MSPPDGFPSIEEVVARQLDARERGRELVPVPPQRECPEGGHRESIGVTTTTSSATSSPARLSISTRTARW